MTDLNLHQALSNKGQNEKQEREDTGVVDMFHTGLKVRPTLVPVHPPTSFFIFSTS